MFFWCYICETQLIYKICISCFLVFGTIGSEIQSNVKIELASGRKSPERAPLARWEFPSKFLFKLFCILNLANKFRLFFHCSGLFFDKYLKYIKLDEDFVQFSKMNLSYLLKVSANAVAFFCFKFN